MWSEFLKTENLVAVGLVIALIISLFIGSSEQLSTNIASGLIGYIGGRKLVQTVASEPQQKIETAVKNLAVDYITDKIKTNGETKK